MNKKYDVILVDPPWKYAKGGPSIYAPDVSYPTMKIDELCNLPVKDIASDNAALFMWVVEWIHPDEWIRVAMSWGFEYRTRAWVWVKSNPSGFGFWSGMGYYTCSNPEDCLIFIRGELPPKKRMSTLGLIYSPRGKHSVKPDEQYVKIETIYPDMKYLELFARRKRDGWDSWGNEIDSDLELS